MKNSFKHFIKHLECKLYLNPKNHKNNAKMFYPKKKHKNNVKYNKIIQLISTLKINHTLLHATSCKIKNNPKILNYNINIMQTF